MLKSLFCFIFIFWQQLFFCQSQFEYTNLKKKTSIPFTVINNLIIIPVNVNGVSLNFLLDTGVEETILFSLDESNEIVFSDTEKIRMKGLGSKDSFFGYKSTKNKVKIKDIIDNNHIIYLVLDQEINISSQIGVPINGIIGYNFFKNQLIKIDYESNKIIVYKNKIKQIDKLKNYTKIPITFHDGKPYVEATALMEDNLIKTKLLIDTGNSDAIWLFQNTNDKIRVPKSNFPDFLGRGFSGDVYGSRGRIEDFAIKDFRFSKPLVAFPDTISTVDIDNLNDRNGSVGAELMRRFTVFYDYENQAMYLKKNSFFNDDFNFNMSGIEIQHQGLQWFQEAYLDSNSKGSNDLFDASGERISNKLKYKFELKPVYIISNIQKNSPADIAGLQKEDIIVKINKRNGFNYSLKQINDLLKSEEGKIINFEVDRKGKIIKIKFKLKSVI